MRNSEPKVAALLLENGADVNDGSQVARGGGAPLHEAAQCTIRREVAALLIANGADVNATIEPIGVNARWRVLHQAAYYNSAGIAVAVLLIANGADMSMRRTIGVGSPIHDMGGTALEIAGRRGHAAVVALLEAAENIPVAAVAEADALAERIAGEFCRRVQSEPGVRRRVRRGFRVVRKIPHAAGFADAVVNFGDRRRCLGFVFGLADGKTSMGGFGFPPANAGTSAFGAGDAMARAGICPSVRLRRWRGMECWPAARPDSAKDGKLRIAAFGDYQARSLLDGERPGMDAVGGAGDGDRKGDDGGGALFRACRRIGRGGR